MLVKLPNPFMGFWGSVVWLPVFRMDAEIIPGHSWKCHFVGVVTTFVLGHNTVGDLWEEGKPPGKPSPVLKFYPRLVTIESTRI
jgi:hypothetical protein